MRVATHIEKKFRILKKFYVCVYVNISNGPCHDTQTCKNMHYRLQFKTPSFCFVQTMGEVTARSGINVKYKIWKFRVIERNFLI